MNLHREIIALKKVSKKDLRNFGLLIGVMILLFAYVIAPYVFHAPIKIWPLVLSLLFFLFSFFSERNLLGFYVPWMLFSKFLGTMNTYVLLTIFFFLVITPLGILKKFFSKDPMRRKFERESSSYFDKLEDTSTSKYQF